MLAAANFEILYLIAAAAYGVFAWWNDRRQKKLLAEEEARRAAAEPTPPLRQDPSGAPAANSEEERMRKFLEALGVPSSTPPPARTPPHPKPEPPKRTPTRPVSPTLAPRPVADAGFPRPFSRPAPVAPPPAPVRPVSVPIPAPYEPEPESEGTRAFRAAAHAVDVTPNAYAQASDADNLRPIGERTVDQISAIPGLEPEYVSPQARALYALLKNRENIQAALVASEVLGPPKALQI
jgi:hypothetical protein